MVGKLPHQSAGRYRAGGDVAGRVRSGFHAQAGETRSQDAGPVGRDLRNRDRGEDPGHLSGDQRPGAGGAGRTSAAAQPSEGAAIPHAAILGYYLRVRGGERAGEGVEAESSGRGVYVASEGVLATNSRRTCRYSQSPRRIDSIIMVVDPWTISIQRYG